MYLEDFREAILIGFFLAVLLGPAFFTLLETAAIKGFRAAILFDLGVIFADIAFIAIAYLSTNQLLEKIKDDPSLFIFGGVLLIAYGIISLIKEKKTFQNQRNISVELINKRNYFKLFLKGFLLNIINVGVLGFWLTIIITVGPQLEMNQNRIISFFTIVLISYLIFDIFKILAAKTLKKKLTPSRIYTVKQIVSILMIVFGGVLLSKGLFPSKAKRLQQQMENVNPY